MCDINSFHRPVFSVHLLSCPSLVVWKNKCQVPQNESYAYSIIYPAL